MESGTSGSIQSSSGGDEEYDSRSEPMSTSAFFTPSHNVHPPIGTHHHLPPPLPPVAPPSTSLFDPFTNYLDTFSRSSPPVVPNLDMMWVRSAPSPPPPATIPLNMGSSSSSPAASGGGGSFPTTSGPAPRNPKKRSRASRRAPTTVLATDTSNFRAMVQEFTGIPAPPFAAGPPFSRSRLDLFGNAATVSSTPPYLLRPFAHKVQYPSFYPSSSVLDHVLSSSTSSSSTSTTSPINFMAASNLPDLRSATIASSTSSNAYQILAPPTNNINISRQHQNQLDDSQQLFTFQSLLPPLPPSPPRYPSSNYLSIPGLEKQPQAGSAGSSWKTGSLLVSNVQSADHQGTESSTSPLIRNEDGTGGNWSEAAVLGGGVGGSVRQYNGSGSTKMNLSSSSSDFHAEKGPENASSTRGEGMVDSWICSSDQ